MSWNIYVKLIFILLINCETSDLLVFYLSAIFFNFFETLLRFVCNFVCKSLQKHLQKLKIHFISIKVNQNKKMEFTKNKLKSLGLFSLVFELNFIFDAIFWSMSTSLFPFFFLFFYAKPRLVDDIKNHLDHAITFNLKMIFFRYY